MRYKPNEFLVFSSNLLEKKGMQPPFAQTVARILLEGGLLGHSTHSIHLLGPYLQDLDSGTVTATRHPEAVRDHGMSIFWDGRCLPGPWLVEQAIDTGLDRLPEYPVFTASIKHSHLQPACKHILSGWYKEIT